MSLNTFYIRYGAIVASGAGDGIQQSTAVAADSKFVNGSVWLGVSSGTLDATLTLEGDSGATPETKALVVRVSEKVRRYYVDTAFTSSATGNVRFKITCNAAGTLQLGGMQVETANADRYPKTFTRTTTEAVTSKSDMVVLADGTIDPDEGSFMTWVYNDLDSNTKNIQTAAILMFLWSELSTGGEDIGVALQYDFRSNAAGDSGIIRMCFNGTSIRTYTLVNNQLAPSRWKHVGMSWKHNGINTMNCVLYIDGQPVDSANLATAAFTLRAGSSRLGGPLTLNGSTTSDFGIFSGRGIYSRAKIYNEQKADADFLAEYNATSANYANQKHLYGYPTDGRFERDVKAQWLFDEASGSIVDEVNGITLTVTGGGTINYQADTSAYSSATPTGIRMAAPGVTSSFGKAGNEANLDLGTNDAVIEWVAYNPDATVLSTWDGSNGGYQLGYSSATQNLSCYLEADDGTTATASIQPIGAINNDNTWHKYRLVLRRSGNAQLFIDGVSKGTSSISALDGKAISTTNCFLLARYNTTAQFIGTITELRISIGNISNNSGGLNGG